MEGQLWKAIVMVLLQVRKRRKRANEKFSDADIVRVYYWAVIHDRTIGWACQAKNWPLHERRKALPSDTTMSRRQRSPHVVRLLDAVEQRVTKPASLGLYWMIDGKPLVIGGCSKDRQAGYGKAAASKAKGYKLHAIVAPEGSIAAWRIAPMNKDEDLRGPRQLPIRDASAIWPWEESGPSSSKPRPHAFDRVAGKSECLLRRAFTSKAQRDRALLRKRDQLGRRADPLATLGPHSPPRPPLGSSQTNPNRPPTNNQNHNLRQLTGKAGQRGNPGSVLSIRAAPSLALRVSV